MNRDKKKISKLIKKGFIIVTILVGIVFCILLFANWKIPHDTKNYIYDNTDSIPTQKAALVLGASKYLRSGHINPYFNNRIKAAAELYKAGKVQAFVVSGDNGHKTYNEPADMRDALIELGVPENVIYLDYAGFRTLDSVVRMSKIFGQDSFIVVSQEFHNERAIFLAQYYGLNAYGYNAKDVGLARLSYKTIIREKFARVKVFVDIVLNKKPKFLGEPVEIK
ncbi:MAG: ElyC/SanA/YdcF family protein [Dysgonomonas sp.]|nr:ElyC/SanA/YdcF family protein [Dysgonomonas sp.]